MKIYTKRELAMLYFPNLTPKSATNKLARWINNSEVLNRRLAAAGYQSANKYFTVRQLKILYEFFGET